MQLLEGARFYRFDRPTRRFVRHDFLLIGDDGRIASVDPHAAGGVTRRKMHDATVLPAFADCHVHLTDTGYFLGEHDLNGARSYDEFARAIARIPRSEFVLAGQYDESTWSD